MAKFAFSVAIKIQVEAGTVQEASRKFVQWRKFVSAAMQGRLQEAGIIRYSIPPVHEFTEVDDAWLENQKMRSKFQQEWEYQAREEPVIPGSKLMLTHRVAVGPKSAPRQEASQNAGI